MCGIYGVFGSDPAGCADGTTLRRMAAALVHRGPDGGGVHRDRQVGFGMCRLSIIDLKTGNQPMSNEDGSVWVVFNGEIYNYRELTSQLLAKGHRFATAADTEVLVHLYEDLGAGLVDQLRGMFAFAIWDGRQRSLLLGRDRLGIKPLFYAATPDGVVFASELKALVVSPWVQRGLDPAAVHSYLQYGYVPDPQSILRGVTKLPPGHTALVRNGRADTPRRYWTSTPFFRTTAPARRESDLADELLERLGDAVQSHLVSDVPVGAFLSGGVDSSTVVGLMAAAGHGAVKTFAVGFEGDSASELPHARRVAQWYGTEHHELSVAPGDLELLAQLLASLDEPFADPSSIPTYLVARLARQHVKVVLSGDGGDEIFAGYDRYRVERRRQRLAWLASPRVGPLVRGASRLLPEATPGTRYLYNVSLPAMARYVDGLSVFPPRALRDLLLDEVGAPDAFEAVAGEGRDLDSLSRLQDFDLRTYLPGDILTKVDRMTMANSLEARVPLLDHPLVEFACALPPALRMRGVTTKYLLKRLLRGRVPPDVLSRPKQGFDPPLHTWLAHRLPAFFAEALGEMVGLTRAGVRRSAVSQLRDRYLGTRRPEYGYRLWALVVLDHSVRTLFDGVAS